MSARDPRDVAEQANGEDAGGSGKGGRHSRWMMIACCVPMLAIAVVIAASGAGFAFLIIAVMCTVMMALMMGGMSGEGNRNGGGPDGAE